MAFGKFEIISHRDVQALEESNEVMLINYDHLISLKPIKIPLESGVIDGYWVRTSNGKKYRALKIPSDLKDMITE